MKKVIVFLFVAAFGASAFACPAGTHPEGGYGPYHKGGYCAPNSGGSPF